MSANWSLFEDPTAIRAILLLTAQNVDYENWSFHEDGRDGAGVVSGADAVAFAKTFVYATNNIAEINGLITGIYTADDTNGTYQDILVKIPDVIPSGKHLRAVLTWSSSPNEDDDYPVNDISDLDLGFRADYRYYYSSMSYDDNVEIVDIDNSSIIAGSEYTLIINLTALRIPPEATFQYFHYAVAWTWVKDHAE